jgi:hypothetical protein
MTVLRTELKAGDQIQIGDTLVTLEHKSGRTARLSIVTEDGVPIRRIPCAESPADDNSDNPSDFMVEFSDALR